MKMKKGGMSLMKNPLFIIITVLIIVIIVLAIFRSVAPSLTMGLGLKAHLGDLKGSFNIEGYEDFDNQSGSSPEFVMFYAPWCGYCKKTMPDFQELMNTYKNGVKITAIDCVADEGMAKKHNVKGYPDIRYYPKGIDNGNHKEYDGGRSLKNFKEYLDGVVEQGPDNAASVM
jgi:thiol-disulfide isomerase/thioredoxin